MLVVAEVRQLAVADAPEATDIAMPSSYHFLSSPGTLGYPICPTSHGISSNA